MVQAASDRPDDALDAADDPLAPLLAAYHEALLVSGPDDVEADIGLVRSASGLDAGSQAGLLRAQRVIRSLVRARGLAPHGYSSGGVIAGSSGDVTFAWQALVASNGAGPRLKQLGRFEIERELGRGGLGVVFLAHDPVLRRQVALKVPRPEVLLSREASARFDREAQTVARLTHPNLVPVFEIGQAGVIKFIASAYCPGPNLAVWLRDRAGPMGATSAALVVAQLADAVQYAHTQGVLHRDIKPSNILLEPNDRQTDLTAQPSHDQALPFVPKLVDFGLAKLDGPDHGETRTGIALGTPGYMAPEQVEGRLAQIGPETDVYGLGTVLYELLTGRCPFAASSDMHSARLILSEEPQRPRQLNRGIPADLEAICLKCLEKSPARRYRSAAELAADLRRFLAQEPTQARPAGTILRVAKWSRRKPVAAALVLVVAAAIFALGTGGALYTKHLREAFHRESQLRRELTEKAVELNASLFPFEIERSQKLLAGGDVSQAKQTLAALRATRPAEKLGFAWHYLSKLADRQPHLVLDHPGEVYGLAYSPDGKTLASCRADQRIRLWDAAAGRLLQSLAGHTAEVNSLGFSPDGAWLYSVDDAGRIVKWDVASGAIVADRPTTGKPLLGVSISPDGKHLATFGDDLHLTVHETAVDWPVVFSRRMGAAVNAAVFLPDGSLAVAGGIGETLRVFGPDWQEQVFEPVMGESGRVVASSSDGATLGVGHGDGMISVLDATTRSLIARWRGHLNEVEALEFAADGSCLVSGGRDGVVRFWDPENGALLDTLAAGTDRVWAVNLSPDGRQLATAGRSGGVLFWDSTKFPWRRLVERKDNNRGGPPSICAERMLVARAVSPQRIELYNALSGAVTAALNLESPDFDVRESQFAPRGRTFGLVVRRGDQAFVELWAVGVSAPPKVTRFTIDRARHQLYWQRHLAFSPAGEIAYIFPCQGKILAVDCQTHVIVDEFLEGDRRIAAIVCPSRSQLITIDEHATVTVLDARSKAVQTTFSIPKEMVTALGFPNSQRLLVVAGRAAGVWNTSNGKRERLIECAERIIMAAIEPSEGEIAVALEDQTIRLIDLGTGQETLRLSGPAGMGQIGFSPDGKTLLAAGASKGQLDVRVWTTTDEAAC